MGAEGGDREKEKERKRNRNRHRHRTTQDHVLSQHNTHNTHAQNSTQPHYITWRFRR